ncbi:hypothetical protein B1L11_43780 [Microbispora sp. GKU 823]|nr:hypothetical protein B1L11_43780 [Microbispora sp. GKU 823]
MKVLFGRAEVGSPHLFAVTWAEAGAGVESRVAAMRAAVAAATPASRRRVTVDKAVRLRVMLGNASSDD